jgi:hypothetical protein
LAEGRALWVALGLAVEHATARTNEVAAGMATAGYTRTGFDASELGDNLTIAPLLS